MTNRLHPQGGLIPQCPLLVGGEQVLARLPDVSMTWTTSQERGASAASAVQPDSSWGLTVKLARQGGSRGQQRRPPRAYTPRFIKVCCVRKDQKDAA